MKYWKHSDYIFCVSSNRRKLQQIFFLLAFVSLVLDFWFRISITQIGQNSLLNQDIDPVYLMLMTLGIPQFISGPYSLYFDAVLLLSCIGAIIRTRYTVFPILFCVLYFLHFTTYNMLAGHHYVNIGILILSFSFIFSEPQRFAFAFSACRFLFCFMMFSAACWKLVRGNLWHTDQTNMLLIQTHLHMLIAGKSSGMLSILKWLISHKQAAHIIWILLILLEGLFILGFITYKWDRLLLVSYLLFFIGGLLIFNIYNYENLLFLITLKPLLKLIITPKEEAQHQISQI